VIFKTILNNAEPFALDLEVRPWLVSIRAQVITSFVALGLGKGGLFISTFLMAMAWLEDAYIPYAIACSLVTVAVLVIAYIAAFGRFEARFDLEAGLVHITKRAPFYRRLLTEPLAHYQGIRLIVSEDSHQRHIQTLELTHPDSELSVPLWQRRRDDAPVAELEAYAHALGVDVLDKD